MNNREHLKLGRLSTDPKAWPYEETSGKPRAPHANTVLGQMVGENERLRAALARINDMPPEWHSNDCKCWPCKMWKIAHEVLSPSIPTAPKQSAAPVSPNPDYECPGRSKPPPENQVPSLSSIVEQEKWNVTEATNFENRHSIIDSLGQIIEDDLRPRVAKLHHGHSQRLSRTVE